MKKVKLIIILMIIMSLCLPFIMPTIVLAADQTLSVTVQKNETEKKIYITAKDTSYNIVEMKYINDYITASDVEVFTKGDSRVKNISITQSKEVSVSFSYTQLGYYTIYTKNSVGSVYLNRINIQDIANAPKIEVNKDASNPLILNITAIATNANIVQLKIAKKDKIDDNIDFTTQGTSILTSQSQTVNVTHTVAQEGIYSIYAKDSNGLSRTMNITVVKEFPINATLNVDNATKKIQISLVDTLFDIVKIKIAKESEISEITDFETKGTNISFTKGKTVSTSYTVAEEGRYYIYFEDEYGYKKMATVTVGTYDNTMTIGINQNDSNNMGKLTILGESKNYDIVEMRVMVGTGLTIQDVKTNGTIINITSGKTITANYQVSQNCTINVYIKDSKGNGKMYTKTITGINDYTDLTPPQITLKQNEQDLKRVDVAVTDEDYIRRVKYAQGQKDVNYFSISGTQIGLGSIGKLINTYFNVNETGIYTVYAEDNNGNKTVKTIEIKSLENTDPNEDKTAPVISGVENGKTYEMAVTPVATDDNLNTVKLYKNGTLVSNYKNGDKIELEGKYELIATDKAGNETKVSFIIKYKEEPQDTTNPTITGVENGKTYDNSVTPIAADENLNTVKLHKNGSLVSGYSNGDKIEEEGNYELIAIDKAGNTTKVSFTIKFSTPEEDKTAPIITGVENGGKYNVSKTPIVTDTNLNTVILFRNNSLVSNYTNGNVIEDEGTYTIVAKDKAGNETKATFIIDKTAPQINTNIDTSKNTEAIIDISVIDNYTQIDTVKVAVGQKSISDFKTQGQLLDLEKSDKSATATIKVVENGTYTIYAKDEVGNEKVFYINITNIENKEEPEDTISPVVTGVDNAKLYTEPVTPVVHDENLDTVILYKDGNIVQGYKNSDTIKEVGNYRLVATDKAGNKTEVSFTIKEKGNPDPEPEDTTAPKITGVENGKTYDSAVTPIATDDNLYKVELYKNGTLVPNYSNGSTIKEVGEYKLIASDKAGNKTEISFVIKEKDNTNPIPNPEEDKTAPVITGVDNAKLYTNPVTPVVHDDNLDTVILYKDGKEVQGYKNSDTIKEAGNYKIVATDKAGNKTEVYFTIKEKDNNNTNNNTTNNIVDGNNSTNNTTSNNVTNNTTSNNSVINNTTTSGLVNNTSKESIKEYNGNLADSKIPKTGLMDMLIFIPIAILILTTTFAGIRYYKIKKK